MSLPLMPPVQPMLATTVDEIPMSGKLIFEPKWDGFRCVLFRDVDEVVLQSRTGKPLNRYFPEVIEAALAELPERVVLDGELVISLGTDGGRRLDWDALTERIHPAASRVRKLAVETPARFVAFDLLAVGDESLLDAPFRVRRRRLTDLAPTSPSGVHVTPATDDRDVARQWLELFEGAGLDGLIGKPADGPYTPGKRTMIKVKHARTADCVVAGLRWYKDTEPGTAVGSLLLGLFDKGGVLHQVGVVGSFPAARRRELAAELAGLLDGAAEGHPWLGENTMAGQRLPEPINRWRSTGQPWEPLRCERVVEVAYDHTEGGHPGRFRHTTQFIRWRPDREPSSCRYDQLDIPARYDLDSVFQGKVRAAT